MKHIEKAAWEYSIQREHGHGILFITRSLPLVHHHALQALTFYFAFAASISPYKSHTTSEQGCELQA